MEHAVLGDCAADVFVEPVCDVWALGGPPRWLLGDGLQRSALWPLLNAVNTVMGGASRCVDLWSDLVKAQTELGSTFVLRCLEVRLCAAVGIVVICCVVASVEISS